MNAKLFFDIIHFDGLVSLDDVIPLARNWLKLVYFGYSTREAFDISFRSGIVRLHYKEYNYKNVKENQSMPSSSVLSSSIVPQGACHASSALVSIGNDVQIMHAGSNALGDILQCCHYGQPQVGIRTWEDRDQEGAKFLRPEDSDVYTNDESDDDDFTNDITLIRFQRSGTSSFIERDLRDAFYVCCCYFHQHPSPLRSNVGDVIGIMKNKKRKVQTIKDEPAVKVEEDVVLLSSSSSSSSSADAAVDVASLIQVIVGSYSSVEQYLELDKSHHVRMRQVLLQNGVKAIKEGLNLLFQIGIPDRVQGYWIVEDNETVADAYKRQLKKLFLNTPHSKKLMQALEQM
jgi:hypothetical protein